MVGVKMSRKRLTGKSLHESESAMELIHPGTCGGPFQIISYLAYANIFSRSSITAVTTPSTKEASVDNIECTLIGRKSSFSGFLENHFSYCFYYSQ